MGSDEARQHAEQLFALESKKVDPTTPYYERRAREVRQKIEYLRELRLAKQRHELSRRTS